MRLPRLGVRSGRGPLIGVILIAVTSSFVATGCDRLTGGGWIRTAEVLSDGRASFGFSAKCRNTTVNGVPVAEMYDGQFQFEDRAFDAALRIHGDVEPSVFGRTVGQTCRQAASDLHEVPQQLSGFEGTYRTQPPVVPERSGTFAVSVSDGGEGPALDGDDICVTLAGDFTYLNCGVVQQGEIQVH